MVVRVGLSKGLDDEGRDGVDERERQAQPTSVVFDSIISVQSSREADMGNSPSIDLDTFLVEETSGNDDVFPMVAVQSMSRLWRSKYLGLAVFSKHKEASCNTHPEDMENSGIHRPAIENALWWHKGF